MSARRPTDAPWRLPLYQFAWGWLAFRILMVWPLRFYDRAPSYLNGWAARFAHDDRNYPAQKNPTA
jgi:hypothetical protein